MIKLWGPIWLLDIALAFSELKAHHARYAVLDFTAAGIAAVVITLIYLHD